MVFLRNRIIDCIVSCCLFDLLQSVCLSSPCLYSGRILEVVTTLANANRTAMSKLYKLGKFEILLWKLLDGDVVDWDKTRIAKFLAQCHSLQVSSPGPIQYLFPANSQVKES